MKKILVLASLCVFGFAFNASAQYDDPPKKSGNYAVGDDCNINGKNGHLVLKGNANSNNENSGWHAQGEVQAEAKITKNIKGSVSGTGGYSSSNEQTNSNNSSYFECDTSESQQWTYGHN